MIVIPFNDIGQQASFLLVLIEHDNFDRMKHADPITLESASAGRGGILPPIKYPDNVHVMIAYEEDTGQIYQWAAEGKVNEIIQHVRRGMKLQDNDGVHATSILGRHHGA